MSKFILEVPFASFSGKICKHAKVIFCKRGDTRYTSQICNPRTKPFTDEEKARHTKFTTAVANADAALADPEKKAAYMDAFNKQTKYKTFRNFVIAQEWKKL